MTVKILSPVLVSAIRRLFEERRYLQVLEKVADIESNLLDEEPEIALTVAASLTYLFRNAEAKEVLERAYRSVAYSGDGGLLRRWQNIYAFQLIPFGRLDEAAEYLRLSLSNAERSQDERTAGFAANGLGIIASIRGDVEDAVRYYTRTLTAAERRGDRYSTGMARHNLGLVLREWGNINEASRNFELASNYFQREGTVQELIYSSSERALLHLDRGDLTLAQSLAEFSLKQAELLANDFLLASSLKCQAVVLVARGDILAARLLLLRAQECLGQTGSVLMRAEVSEELAIVEALAGNHAESEIQHEAAVGYYFSMGSPRQVDRAERRFLETTKPSGKKQ